LRTPALNNSEVKEQYQIKISYWLAALENLDISRAWMMVKIIPKCQPETV
jgi:hypothetical protein